MLIFLTKTVKLLVNWSKFCNFATKLFCGKSVLAFKFHHTSLKDKTLSTRLVRYWCNY